MENTIPPSAGLTPEEKKKAFLARWIPFGLRKLAKAEAFGLDWENIPFEKLDFEIIAAEQFAAPDPE